MDKSKLAQQAKETIKECLYLNIASVTSEGNPWNTPVYYTFDEKFNLYWGSPKDCIHSANIRNKPNVFITIYVATESGIGVYIEAQSFELTDPDEIDCVIKILGRGKNESPNTYKDFLNDSPLRLYKAVPKKISISTPELSDKYKGLWVDHRADITNKFINS